MRDLKRLTLIISLLIVLTMFVPAVLAAVTPEAPVIEDIDPVFAARNSVTQLTVTATITDGGTLAYQWYETSNGTLPSIMAIIGQESPTFTCNTSTSGTRYYVCMATNTIGSEVSRTYSNVIAVTIYEPVPMVSYNATNVELDKMDEFTITADIQLQQKDIGTLTYTWYESTNNYIGVGEVVSGATTKNLTLNGSNATGTRYYYCIVWNLYLGVTYSMNVEDMSIVKVVYTGKEHVHQFGAWMVTTEPTCTEDGIKTRECECGVTEREGIPALGHDFGDWTVDPDNANQETRTCRRDGCGIVETRPITKSVIPGVLIEITAPETGMSVREYWIILHSALRYSIDEDASFWEYSVAETEGTWKEVTDGEFAPQTVYRASLLIYPVEGDTFDSSTIVSINGNSVAYDLMEDGNIRVRFSFPKTDSTDSEVNPTDMPDDEEPQDDDEEKATFPTAVIVAIIATPVVLGAGALTVYWIRKKKV